MGLQRAGHNSDGTTRDFKKKTVNHKELAKSWTWLSSWTTTAQWIPFYLCKRWMQSNIQAWKCKGRWSGLNFLPCSWTQFLWSRTLLLNQIPGIMVSGGSGLWPVCVSGCVKGLGEFTQLSRAEINTGPRRLHCRSEVIEQHWATEISPTVETTSWSTIRQNAFLFLKLEDLISTTST